MILEREQRREGGGESERDINVREKHQSVASHMCTLTGDRTHNLLVYGLTLQQTETAGQSLWYFGRDCIEPTDCFGCVDIIIMLILSIHEHGICSHLFESSDFFFNVFIQGFSCAMKTLHSCMQ